MVPGQNNTGTCADGETSGNGWSSVTVSTVDSSTDDTCMYIYPNDTIIIDASAIENPWECPEFLFEFTPPYYDPAPKKLEYKSTVVLSRFFSSRLLDSRSGMKGITTRKRMGRI